MWSSAINSQTFFKGPLPTGGQPSAACRMADIISSIRAPSSSSSSPKGDMSGGKNQIIPDSVYDSHPCPTPKTTKKTNAQSPPSPASCPFSCSSSDVMLSQSLSSAPAHCHRLSTRYAACSWNWEGHGIKALRTTDHSAPKWRRTPDQHLSVDEEGDEESVEGDCAFPRILTVFLDLAAQPRGIYK